MKKDQACAICSPAAVAVGVAVLATLAACGDSKEDGVGGPAETVLDSYLYVSSTNTQGDTAPGEVYQFRIGSDGTIAPLTPASVNTGRLPLAVLSDPSGNMCTSRTAMALSPSLQ
jgi:hypothetical protein